MEQPKGLPRLRLVCGTGRCGTWAMYRILEAQGPQVQAHHEGLRFPWEQDPCTFYYYMLNAMISWKGSPFWSDSSFAWIRYIGLLFKYFKGPKVLCLKRDKDLLIESFLKHWKGENYWTDPDSKHWDDEWPKVTMEHPEPDKVSAMWPKYDLPKRDAIAAYYDEYYEMAEFWQHRLPDSFMIMDMLTALNTEDGQGRIFEFFDITAPRLYVGLRLNEHDDLMGPIYKETHGVHGTSRIYEDPHVFRSETGV